MILTVTLNPCIDKTLTLEYYTPGTGNRVQQVEAIAGGKGINVARMARNLGAEVLALCILGGTAGIEIGNLLARDRIPYHGVIIQERSREITTVRETLAERQTVFFEPGPALNATERDALLAAYRKFLPASQLVVLGGAIPNSSCVGLYPAMIALAREQGKRVILDSHGTGLKEGIAARPYMVKPNQEEAAEILGRPVKNEADIQTAAQHFLARGIAVVVISLGKAGALLVTENLALRAYPPHIKEINPVGSGDSLVAGLAVGILKGYSWEESLRLGVAAGAANAAMWTASSCTREQVEALLPAVKITPVSPAVSAVTATRAD
ncbi:1-phosphofructokinase family hexose kinase [Moorella naiadis]|uniref:1-phosphofructokinase family hexose kinase n=1 Tax=Moorella naiadis (nom. illeg.) TaxID=3093670 RepID=UPI003D9CB288